MTSITVSLSCAWLVAGGVAILTLIGGAWWIWCGFRGGKGFECATCTDSLTSHIVTGVVVAAILAVVAGFITSFITEGLKTRAVRLEDEAVQQEYFAERQAEGDRKRAERNKERREVEREERAALTAAEKSMVDAIPVEWSPLRATLRTNKMRNSAKAELFTKILGSNMPKLSINQQWYIIEKEFDCNHKRRQNNICEDLREQLAKALAAHVDITIIDSLTEYENQLAWEEG